MIWTSYVYAPGPGTSLGFSLTLTELIVHDGEFSTTLSTPCAYAPGPGTSIFLEPDSRLLFPRLNAGRGILFYQ